MKILAIRGKNLTSLAGEFDVDFQAEPLASAGLFAISGPTGAGKSTLLDAICLALYEQTPRLFRTGGRGLELPDVGQEKITPQDPRTILRRGTADGYAEVDFEGNDRIAYRARWSVRRASGKLSGRLQKTEHSLLRIGDQQRIGGTNSEVRSEIEQRIGLGFDQFTRAVILAQNEFAAFLKADDNLRGELLETLTGTDIYTGISMRAFERAKSEQAELERLSGQLADQRPLDPAQRVALELQAAQAVAAVQSLDIAARALEDHLRWFNALRRLQQDESAAGTVLQNALAEQASAQSRRTLLRMTEAVQPARPLVADADRLAHEAIAAQDQEQRTLAALEAVQRQRAEALAALDAAAGALRQAETAEVDAMPALNRARMLDAEIDALAPVRDEMEQRWRTLCQSREDAESRHRAVVAEHAAAIAERQATDAWLIENRAYAALAAGWQGFDIFFAQASEAWTGHAAALAALAEARKEQDRLAQASLAAEERRSAAAQNLVTVADRRASAAAEQARFDVQHLAAERQRIARRRYMLAQAASVWCAMQAAAARKAELASEISRLQDDMAAADAERAAIDQLCVGQQAVLAQAEASLRIAQAACAENIETLREALQADMPCPVCGSETHPYRTGNPQLRAVMASLETEIGSQRLRYDELLRRQSHLNATSLAARGQCALLARALSAVEAEHLAAASQWTACAPDDIAQEDPAAWLDERLQIADDALQTLGAQEAQWHAAVERTRHAQTEHDQAFAHHAVAAEAAQAAEKAAMESRIRHAAWEEQQQRHATALENALLRLDPAFEEADWRQQWRRSPAAYYQHCRQMADAWRQHSEQAEEQATRLAGLAIRLSTVQADLDKARHEDETGRRAFDDIAGRLDASRLQRHALFDGQATATAEGALHDATRRARLRLADSEKAAQAVHQDHARADMAATHARQVLLDARARAAESATRLEEWRGAFNLRWEAALDLDALREALGRGPDWIGEQKRILETIETAVRHAEAILAERRMRCMQHEEHRPTEEEADAIAIRLRALEGEKAQASHVSAALQLDVKRDEERKSRHAQAAQALADQEARTRLWAQMNELIGSADGKKFRNYAQQFTLDILLAHANRHLANLSRRYRVERLGATLGLMVIDQDMGDEARSVHSLSGGESFLVSLALALALASLSSDRISVESLFIDEGFGSLDSDTLLVAMEALDQLQAQGRKVGVISHVQEMTERIGTQIQIRRTAGGYSRIIVPGRRKPADQ